MGIKRRTRIVWLASILALSIFLRFFYLGVRPLYGDEPWNTVQIAAQPVSFIMEELYGSILYTLILHFILPLGDTVFMARLPAAVFGVLGVLGVFLVARRLFGDREGLFAALLLALSTHAIFFSQQARGYSGLLFFSVLTLYLFLKAVDGNSPAFWLLYAVSSTAGIFMHFFSLILIPLHGLYLGYLWMEKILSRTGSGESRKIFFRIGAYFLSVAAVLFVSYFLYAPIDTTADYSSRTLTGVFQARLSVDPLSVAADTVKRILIYQKPFTGLFYAKIFLCLAGMVFCLKRKRRELALLLICLVPPFLLFSLANPYPEDLPADNKFIFITPILCILMARGLVQGARTVAAGLSHAGLRGNEGRLRSRVFAVVLVLIIFLEAPLVMSYRFYFWKLPETGKRGDICRRLRHQLPEKEYAVFTESLDKSRLASVAPLVYPDGHTRGIVIQEDESWRGEDLFRAKGLWVFLKKNPDGIRLARRLSDFSGETRIEEFSKTVAVRFAADDGLLRDKLLHTVDVLAADAAGAQQRIHALLKAKIQLTAEGDAEAIRGILPDPERPIRPASLSRTERLIRRIKSFVFYSGHPSPWEAVESRLIADISEIVLDKSGNLDHRNRPEDALALIRDGLALDPGNIRLLFTAAGIEARAGRLDEALVDSVRILETSSTPDVSRAVMRFLRDLPDMNPAVLVWRGRDSWHIRWWTDRPRIISGRIESSRPIERVRESGHDDGTRWNLRGDALVFESRARRNRFHGLDLFLGPEVEISVHMKIEDLRDISRRIILGEKERPRPDTIPFTLGGSSRTENDIP